MSEAKADAAPKSKKKLMMFIIIGVVVLVLLVGGGLAAFLMLKSGNSEDDGGQATKTEAKKDAKKKKDEKKAAPVFEKLAQFTVNLNAPETNEVLQTDISVELSNVKEKDLLKQYMPKIQSEVNKLLRSKKPEEVKTAAGTDKLGAEIRELINKILKIEGEGEGVLSVQFTTFIVR
ncbi:flagellar FliL protein [Formivibrio citricus]|uniref:Flagellar protein FliL n=1 Tax=Formivibrio citricus TaxID=83765 RepID=A0A1I5ASD1_9NEIS|nr:flagellar basal body-associated FliL family protein [Formivibrio citricus]SFN65355.1 flagellar FliL protein [Formivibrio citricus]